MSEADIWEPILITVGPANKLGEFIDLWNSLSFPVWEKEQEEIGLEINGKKE